MAAPAAVEVDPLQFLRDNFDQPFDEARAATLFNLYCVEGPAGTQLVPQDIRQLIYDLLTVGTLPLVVPDITLQRVYAAIRPCESPEQRGIVTREEMYAYLMMTTDDAAPALHRILQVVQQSFDHTRLNNAVYVLYRPEAPVGEDVYDRGIFIAVTMELIPNATDIFVYFVKSGDAMVLVCVDGELPPFTSSQTVQTAPAADGAESAPLLAVEPDAGERPPPMMIEDRPYLVDIAPFNVAVDIFPPARRSGGMRSRVARTLADTYVKARSWDQSHYQIATKTKEAAQTALTRAKAFDEQHQISTRVQAKTAEFAAKAAELDQQYQLSEKAAVVSAKATEIASKVAAHPSVKSAATTVGSYLKGLQQAVAGGAQETAQLVHEKRTDAAESAGSGAAPASEAPAS